MKDLKFTKGEWKITEVIDNEKNLVYCKIGCDKKAIAFAGVYGGKYNKTIPYEEAEANAKLIAAAPKMLEALYAIHNMLDEKRQKGKRMSDLEWEIHLTSWNTIQKATE